ncbi:MAG: S41 family peptidase [Pseudomonadota bacterium]
MFVSYIQSLSQRRARARAIIPAAALVASSLVLAAFAPHTLHAEALASAEPAGAQPSLAASPRDAALSDAQIREDLDLARRTLEQMHPGYTRYTSAETLDALWVEGEAQALAQGTRGGVYLAVSRLLARIRCDHTKAELPGDFEEARQSEPLYLPFRYAIFDKRMIVTNPGATGLVRGEIVSAIDGEPVADIIDKVFALFPVDGDTDHIKGESVSEFGEFLGPAFEHFYPFLYETSGAVTLTLGDGREVSLDRLTYPDFAAITGQKRFSQNFADSVTFTLLNERAAYLSVDTFVNYRKPVAPDTVYQPIFETLARSGRDTLIVDLRRNGGGSTDAQIGLVQWLMPEAFQQAEAVLVKSNRIDPAIRPHLSSWNEAALSPDPAWFKQRADGMFEITNPLAGKPPASIAAKPGAFKGRLIVLTSSDNASGVTHLLSVLRTQRDATFIGERTGGAATGATAGILAFLTLPNSKAKVRVPLQRTVIAKAQDLDPRGGITPDILAPDTATSVLAGVDPAMIAALDFIAAGE